MTIVNAPSSRYDHAAVWTGEEMIVWGGNDSGYVQGSSGPIVNAQVIFQIVITSPEALSGNFSPSSVLSDSTGQYAVDFRLDALQCQVSCVGAPECSVQVRAVAAGVASNVVSITESL
jgi:hypothetical protein